MKNIVGMAAIVAIAGTASADVIASTSFENASTGNRYFDFGNAMMDHDLVNNLGQADVDFTADMIEMGYDAYYRNTRNAPGLTDGDDVGITNDVTEVGMFTDGTQGYRMSDTDGVMGLAFDTVNFTGTWGVTLDLFIESTGWETSDNIRVWVEVDGGTEVDLFNTGGEDIDNLFIEDSWMNLSLDLSTFTTATLFVELDSNSTVEAIVFDNVVFDGVVPTPGSMTLLSFGGLLAARRRR